MKSGMDDAALALAGPRARAIFANPENPSVQLTPYLDLLQSMLDQLSLTAPGVDATETLDSEAYLHLSSSESMTTISILGERGSGKTTLLQYYYAKLLSDGYNIILPIVRPERFAGRDTLTGWALSAIQTVVEHRYPDILDKPCRLGRSDFTVATALERIRRDEALLDHGYSERLPAQNLSPSDFGRDATHLNSIGASFTANWLAFTTQLLALISTQYGTSDGSHTRLIVVPIDDADLRPDLLPKLFIDLRRLSSNPSVVFLFCANLEATRHALLSHYLRDTDHAHQMALLLDHGFVSNGDVLNVVSRQIDKSLPSHLRVQLGLMTERDRLLFTPLGANERLIDLLSRVQLFGVPHLSTLDRMFVFDDPSVNADGNDPISPTPYVACLSPIPRNLEYLHKQLSRILAQPSEQSRNINALALQVLVQHGFDNVQTQLPPGVSNVVSWHERPNDESLAVEFDFRSLTFGHTIGSGYTIRRLFTPSGVLETSVRRVSRFSSHFRPTSDGEPTDDLPQAFTQAIFLSRELLENSTIVRFEGQYGSVQTPGGGTWADIVQAELNREQTDNRFWQLPDWDFHFDFYLYQDFWNDMVEGMQNATKPTESDDLLEFFLLRHLEIVCHIQRSRTIPDYLRISGKRFDGQSMSAAFDSWITEREESEMRIEALFEEIYANSFASREQRDRDFALWFDNHLIWAADRLACSEHLSEWILHTRGRIVNQHNRLVTANAGAARQLSRRIRASITTNWIESLITLLAHVDEQQASQIRLEWSEARTRVSDELKAVLASLAAAGVPQEVLSQITQVGGVTSQTAKSLQEANVRPDFVGYLRDRFGLREIDDGEEIELQGRRRKEEG